jgi:hypothetical protein
MNALFAPGAKRTRVLVAFGLTLLLATPAMMIWAGKAQLINLPGDDSKFQQALMQSEARKMGSVALPPGHMPPAEFSPFGGVLKSSTPGAEKDAGRVDWDSPRGAWPAGMKPGLLWEEGEKTRNEKGTLRPGLLYVRLSPAGEKDLDEAVRFLSTAASIVAPVPDSTFLVSVEARNLQELRQSPYVEKYRPMEPAEKLSADFGARPQIEKARASNPNIMANITLAPGVSTSDAARAIKQIPGVSDVSEALFGGQLSLKIHYASIDRLARRDEIVGIDEVRDVKLSNDENVPTVQAGSAEDANFMRPFETMGIDGGGIDTNLDGERNNPSAGGDAVRPQIVAVIDNGISYDTPSFSQTSTLTTTLQRPIGPLHRKIHTIQAANDSGTSCDSPLHGGNTHGNVVASVIAAYPSQFGTFASRSGIGGPTQPRNVNLDGIARGSRILVVDKADTTRCNTNSLIERGGDLAPFTGPGQLLLDRLNLAICPIAGGAGACAAVTGGGTDSHLAVLPFGAPANFSTFQFQASNGTYPQESADVDRFLYNNRDYMLMVPVGNNGGLIGNNRLGLALRVIPDLFNGSALDEDPNAAAPIQISTPATAKNVVSVAAGTADCFTFFGVTDCEEANLGFSSRGPATPGSLRMAPMIVAPGFDLVGTPYTAAVAVFRSNDDDNIGSTPLDAQMDEGNFGSSYAAGYITGAGALIQDYFAQGFYPTGERVTADRVARVSGAFVKAALAASADFMENGLGTQGEDNNERNVRRTRAYDLGTVVGQFGSKFVGIMGNAEQGYGRAVLTHVLPLSNWPDNFLLHPNLVNEFPAAGLLAFDRMATGEPLINNTTQTSVTHTIRVATPFTTTKAALPSGHVPVAASIGQLRIALAWPDLPSAADVGGNPEGGQLKNDLDLIVEGPGPDNCLTDADTRPNGTPCLAGSGTDNQFFDGNNYDGGRNNPVLDQWSRIRTTEIHDFRNPLEAVHLSGDPNADGGFSDSPIYIGRWRVIVRRGWGADGAPENPLIINSAVNEDTNANGRLDSGEDVNPANGLLDQPGQPYALVVAGPVFLAEANPPAGPVGYPASDITWTRSFYNCASNAVLNVLDTTNPAFGLIASRVQYQVLNTAGAVVDTETNFDFHTTGSPFAYESETIPIRLANPGFNGNGVLEADTGYQVVATYTAPGQRVVLARAAVQCSPDLVNASFAGPGGLGFGDQWAINNGCDNDSHFDAGEIVTYGVALQNRSRTDFYADTIATLTPSGPGAGALAVIDSPKNLGSLPGNGTNGVFFHVKVDAAAANALSIPNRVVTMTLTLDSLVKGQRVGRQSYAFNHAINADTEKLYFSTDYPNGGREVRDLNRNLVIDPSDSIDPFLGFILPNEDVTFTTLFSGTSASNSPPGVYANQLGEDLDYTGRVCAHNLATVCTTDANCASTCSANVCTGSNPPLACANNSQCVFTCLTFTASERDLIPDQVLSRGILVDGAPAGTDLVPWNFDSNSGGWVPFRHPNSTQANINSNPVWEYKTTGGLCGFQTAAGASFGIWHTGDGNPATPGGAATACDNHSQPSEIGTPTKVELIMDVLESPIIAKVNQLPDARGFQYTVEFQRFGFNENIQTMDGYAGGGINIDNDADSDNTNSLLNQEMDAYYTRRTGGWPYALFRDTGQYFNGPGVDPTTFSPFQRTFGPWVDVAPIGTPSSGDTGFSGFTSNQNPASASPIPLARPDFLPYPLPTAPAIGVCDHTGFANDGATCDPNNGADPCQSSGGACFTATNDVRGPGRNFDATLVGYEGGQASIIDSNPPENFFFFVPGRAANRWQIGIGFWALESPSGLTDYGKGVDDVVFEWAESHPLDESAFVPAHTAACQRYNTPGNPQGGQCATLTADRTTLYECDEGIEITLYDAKCLTGPTPGAGCTTDAQCGGGDCTADNATVNVTITTESDSVPVDYQGQQVFYPTSKLFPLSAVVGSPGLFRGTVIFSTTTDTADHVFNVPGSDSTFTVYYFDPLCDGDRDGQANEDDFANVDGDNIPDNNDKCPQIFDPGQGDMDGDGVGDLCDNCPNPGFANPGQEDINADLVGDICEFDDRDGLADFAGDGTPDTTDNCPEIRNPEQTDSDVPPNGVGDLCDVQKAAFGSANGRRLHSFYYFGACTDGTCDYPLDAVGDNCTNDQDCNRACNTVTDLCEVSGTCVGVCSVTTTQTCLVNGDCPAGQTCNGRVACQWSESCNGAGGSAATFNCILNFTSPWDKAGQSCLANGNSDCFITHDRDSDGVPDTSDNCILTPNGPNGGPSNQTDTDNDNIGNACDPDCKSVTTLGRCSSNGNTSSAQCATNGHGYTTNFTRTVTNNGTCSNVDDDVDADFVEDPIDNCPTLANNPIIAGTQRQRDSDRDGLGDLCDPAGTFDDENDGIPDDTVTFNGTIACRTQALANFAVLSTEYRDNNPGNGDHDVFPDTGEIGRVQIQIQNLGPSLTDATIVMTSSDPDVACVNRPSLLVGDIPNGEIVTFGNFNVGTAGLEFTAANAPELEFTGIGDEPETVELCITVVANETMGVTQPICFSLLADLNVPPGVEQTFTKGADGLAGTSDDGITIENFDTDRTGDFRFTVNDTFLQAVGPGLFRGYCSTAATTECDEDSDCPVGGTGPGICYRGSYIKGSDTGGAGTVAGVTCGGYDDEDENPGGCLLDPDFPFDWHLHCPIGFRVCTTGANAGTTCSTDAQCAGVTGSCQPGCPNLETGTCVGGCSYNTPTGGQKAHSGGNSLHMGAHFVQTNNLSGDTSHFRTLQGYQTAPLNMALFPRAGDLQMSFYHIARLMDNNGVGPNNANQCVDCGDVQVQLDGNPDAVIDEWGFWDKLVPFQNVYDHKPNAWSVFGSYYCLFTPTDTGNQAPNPRGVQETLCYPLGVWSHCGSVSGTAVTTTLQCLGPGELDPTGIGVWVQSKFNLSGFLGQRIRIRWIAETWNFANAESSYYEIGAGWDTTSQDDGWWLDDIEIRGTVVSQVTPEADLLSRTGSCPVDPCNNAVGDNGTLVVLKLTDLAGNEIDGINVVQYAGQPIRVSAIESSLPGGCIGGVAEYEFTRVSSVPSQSVIVQPFGPKTFFLDAPETNTTYFARARCSTDTTGPGACVSIVGATIDSGPYSGVGGDTFFGERASPATAVRGVEYFRGVCTAGTITGPCNAAGDCGTGGVCSAQTTPTDTTDDQTRLRWWGPGNYGTDLLRGTIPAGPAPKGTLAAPFWNLSGLASPCVLSNVAGTPVTGGPGSNYTSGLRSQATDPNPGLNAVIYYDVTTNSSVGGNLNAFGCANPAMCNNRGWCELSANAGSPCNADADCPSGYCAVNRCTAGATGNVGKGCTTDAHCGTGGVCGATPAATDPDVPTFCTSDAGVANQGGCGKHPVCAAGTFNGRLCQTNTDCSGGTCPILTPPVQTAGQLCYNLVGVNLPPPFGSCPVSGHPKKLTRQINGGLVCP